jgi:hypothetical protein
MRRRTTPGKPSPDTSAAAPKPGVGLPRTAHGRSASPAAKQPAGTEMLSARVDITIARRFRSLAKLRGEKVQSLLQTVLTEYLERNRF